MNLPLELIIKIFEFLPSEVIFKLWCTGRELHGIKSIYINKILPHVRFKTILKLEKLQKSLYVQIDDGGILKNYGIVGCTVKITTSVIMLDLGFAHIYMPTFFNYSVFKYGYIIVAVQWINDDLKRRNGYILQKAEFKTCYLIFALLKLKISTKILS